MEDNCLVYLLVEGGALVGQKVVGDTTVAGGEALVIAADGVALDLKAKAPDCLLPALCLDEVPARGRPLTHAPDEGGRDIDGLRGYDGSRRVRRTLRRMSHGVNGATPVE